MQVKITKGHATVKDFCPLGIGREYDKKVLEGARGSGNIEMTKVVDADMILVLGMCEKVVVNKVEVTLTEEGLEAGISYRDYEKIKEACESIKDGDKKEEKEEAKKKS